MLNLEFLPFWSKLFIPWGYFILVLVFYVIKGSRKKWGRKIRDFEYSIVGLVLFLTIYVTFFQLGRGGLLPDIRWFYALPIVWAGVFLDVNLTKRGLALGAIELNPVMKWIIKKLGLSKSTIVPLGGTLLILAFSGEVYISWTVIAVYLLIIANNLYHLRELTSRRRKALVVI